MHAEPRGATGPLHERMRSRIELRELGVDPRIAGLGIGCAVVGGTALWAMIATAVVSLLGLPRIALVVVGVGGAIGILGLLLGGLVLWQRARPISHLLELAPPGSPHNATLRGPHGALLGETCDGSLVVRDAQYLRSARGGARWSAAVVLEVRGARVGALACLGPADVRPNATQIDTPRLGDLYPRELEYLRAR